MLTCTVAEGKLSLASEGRGAITYEERDAVTIVPGSLVSLPAGLPHRIEGAVDSRLVVISTTLVCRWVYCGDGACGSLGSASAGNFERIRNS